MTSNNPTSSLAAGRFPLVWQWGLATLANLSVRTKLILAFLGVTVLSVGLVAFVVNRVIQDRLTDQVGTNLHTLAEVKAQQIAELLDRQLETLSAYALSSTFRDAVEATNARQTDDPKAIRERLQQLDVQWDSLADNDPLIVGMLGQTTSRNLREFQQNSADFIEMLVTNQYGELVGATQRSNHYYYGDEVWWQTAYNNGQGAVYIGQPEFHNSISTFGFVIAVPVRSRFENQRVVGVLRSTYSLAALTEGLALVRFGQTGSANLLLPSGQILSVDNRLESPKPELVELFNLLADQPYAQFALHGGTPRLVSQVPIAEVADNEGGVIQQLNWKLMVDQDTTEALAPVDRATQIALLASLGSLLLAGVLALLIAQPLVAPITELIEVAAQIADGDLSAQARVRAKDEIGTLASTFNTMTTRLRETLASLENRGQHLETIAGLTERLSALLNLDELLPEVVHQIKAKFGYYHAHIYLLDDQQERLVVAAGTGAVSAEMKAKGYNIPLNASTSLVACAARSGQLIQVDNVPEAEDWLPNPLLPDTHSEIAVPITLEGQIVGVLDVHSDKIAGLNEGDASLLHLVANQMAVAVRNARLFEQTIRSKDEAEIAKEKAEQARAETEAANKAMEVQVWQTTGQALLSDKMRGEQDISTLANSIIQQLCQYLQAQIGALYVVEDHSLTLAGRYAYSSKKPAKPFKFGEGLVGQVAVEKRPMIIANVPNDYLTVRSGLGETIPKNIMLFPFMYNDRVVGVIEMGTLTEFSQTQLEFIQRALASITIAFNTAQARARINELLAQTQRQTEELQAQGEELRVTNEELETQTDILRASESKLKEKQIELEGTNARLEEQATILEENSQALRGKQAVLDRQNQELKTAQQELEQKAEELALASKYKSEFLANMSHELRTPLNSLLILARLLADNEEGNLNEDQVESAQIIYSGGTDLLNLINDILDLSKVESGKMSFNFEAMPLTELATMVRTQFAHVAQEKGLALNITLADDLPASIETDTQRVKQIVKNLLSNAFKFTTAGSISLDISRPEARVKLSRSQLKPTQAIAISIADTGIGMTLEQQKVIFEAFQQADGSTSRQYGGTGLGLSISRELAARLGGQIDVKSEPAQGSTFTLYLPIERKVDKREAEAEKQAPKVEKREVPAPSPVSPPPSTPAAPQSAPEDDRAELKMGDKILLIIEDDPQFAKVVYDFAHKKAFKGLIALDGRTGLALVKSYKPEAIILDLNLPDISGWEVLHVLKDDPATRHIPVHIISADEEMLDAYRQGAMGYLTKPVSQAGLDESFQKIGQFIAKEIKTLLLVEDDANSRRSIKKLLGGSDVQISEAERGQVALDLLKTQHFDCMILDLSLPDMTGFEVLNKMNGHAAMLKCPVIVYTGQDLTPEENLELMKYTESVIVKGVKSPERLLDEAALFLHRVVADMPEDKQQTIKQLYIKDGLLKDKKILIVDDDMRNSFALSKLLSDKGVSIKIAQNGQKALESLAEEPVDLVLMDIMMPVMDGYETIRHIRTQPQFRSLPVLALTAKAMKDDQEKCLAAGANDYLSKPIDIDRLFSMLRVWLYR